MAYVKPYLAQEQRTSSITYQHKPEVVFKLQPHINLSVIRHFGSKEILNFTTKISINTSIICLT